jgi:hypothetical protein
MCVCAQSVNKIITVRNLNNTTIFVNKVENSIWEKPLRGSQTHNIHYSEDKTSYKVVTLTYPWCSGRTLHSNG